MRFLLLFLVIAKAAGAQQPAVRVMDARKLADTRAMYRRQDADAVRMVDRQVQDAARFLHHKTLSVMDKAFVPASGSKHDYMSQAPYFWYDSSKPNGLPYMRRDGHRNPEINKITDKNYLTDLESATRALATAWYYTGDEKYAAKASQLLSAWFIDTATKMNPNLDYGQAIPGVNNGRGIGIIETIALMGISDAAELLQGSASWTSSNDAAVRKWYAEYLQWMLMSKNGKEEHAAKNNHGTWYYAQAVCFALFTGNTTLASQLSEESKKLIDGQIASDGRMQLELERTNALSYSTYNLQGWYRLATLAERVNVDLWHYTNDKKAGLLTAVQWLYPYAMGEKPFPYQQIDRYNNAVYRDLLATAAIKYNDPSLKAAANAPKVIDAVPSPAH